MNSVQYYLSPSRLL